MSSGGRVANLAKGGFSLMKDRSLYLKVNPAPKTLSERRAVLQSIQRYGQVEVFKSLANASSFITVPKKPKTAEELIDKSPFEFNYVSESFDSVQAKTVPGANPVGVASPVETTETTAHKLPDKDMVKTFVVHVFPSRDYAHKTTIRYSPLHGPWPKTDRQDQDFVYTALREVVPEGMARNGLCDWQTGGQLSDEARMLRAQAKMSSQVQERMQRRLNRERTVDARRQTLVGLSSLTNLKESIQAIEDEAAARDADSRKRAARRTHREAF